MHQIQKKLLSIMTPNGFGKTTLDELGGLVGIKYRQKVKYHLNQLERVGLISVVRNDNGRILKIVSKVGGGVDLVSVPIYGSANCGPATLVAEENFEGYLKVSRTMLHTNPNNLFALKAVGPSMNKADIPGGPVEDGDYLVVDSENRTPNSGEYIVSVIDGCANVKKFVKEVDRVVLLSESETPEKFPPIFICEDDEFLINGKVVQVVKKPKGGD